MSARVEPAVIGGLVAVEHRCDPVASGSPTALILNAAMVHRVGPNGLSVRLARMLQKKGIESIRFDHRGIGDTPARTDRGEWREAFVEEVQLVMDHVETRRPGGNFFVLGLCTGAVTAFNAASADARVIGAVLMNPRGLDPSLAWRESILKRAPHAVGLEQRMDQSATNAGEATASVKASSQIGAALATLRDRFAPTGEVRDVKRRISGDLERIMKRDVSLLVPLSSGDQSVIEMRTVIRGLPRAARRAARGALRYIKRSDHAFTLLEHQREVLQLVERWVDEESGRWSTR